jgi:hypothetical protein
MVTAVKVTNSKFAGGFSVFRDSKIVSNFLRVNENSVFFSITVIMFISYVFEISSRTFFCRVSSNINFPKSNFILRTVAPVRLDYEMIKEFRDV